MIYAGLPSEYQVWLPKLFWNVSRNKIRNHKNSQQQKPVWVLTEILYIYKSLSIFDLKVHYWFINPSLHVLLDRVMVESFAIRTFLFVEEISWCYHSNEFSLAEPCILQFFFVGFWEKKFEFFFQNFTLVTISSKRCKTQIGRRSWNCSFCTWQGEVVMTEHIQMNWSRRNKR